MTIKRNFFSIKIGNKRDLMALYVAKTRKNCVEVSARMLEHSQIPLCLELSLLTVSTHQWKGVLLLNLL